MRTDGRGPECNGWYSGNPAEYDYNTLADRQTMYPTADKPSFEIIFNLLNVQTGDFILTALIRSQGYLSVKPTWLIP
jgi:hypothetical protein